MSNEGKPTLGEFLRKEREKRGLTLEQVASATKIGIRLLHSLESDQYAELPAKPFIRGFVTSYCRFIGLDHKEVLTAFNGFIEEKAHERPNREAGNSGYAFEKRDGEQSRMILAVILGSLVVLGGIGLIFFKPHMKKHHRSYADKLREAHATPSPGISEAVALPAGIGSATPVPSLSVLMSPTPSGVVVAMTASPTASPSAVTPSYAPSPSPSPASSPSSSPSPQPSASPSPDPLNSGVNLRGPEQKHKVVFKAQESVWVRYQVDDRPVMQFVLKKDKILVLRAREKVLVQVGNPKDLSFSYNGSGYKPLFGDKNVVMRQDDATLSFPPQVAEKTTEPFPGEKPLSGRTPPRSPAPESSAQPSI